MVKTYRIKAESATFNIVLPEVCSSIEFRNTSFENVFVDFLIGSEMIRLEGKKNFQIEAEIKSFSVVFQSPASIDILAVLR